MAVISELIQKFESYLSSEILNLECKELYGDIHALLVSSLEDLKIKRKYISALNKTEAVRNRTWEILNTGNWCDVPFSIRRIYASACLIKVCCILHSSTGDILSVLNEVLSSVDDGLLLGAGLRSELTSMASTVSAEIHSEWLKVTKTLPSRKLLDYEESIGDWDLCGVKGEPVTTIKCPSLETFSLSYFTPKLPTKLSGCIDHWPALTKWKDVDYLLRVGGGRKVPVEMGSQYTQSDWSMKLCTLRDFIMDHILNKQPYVGYLAQHQLFNQVPELNDDIRVPEYCCLSDSYDDPNVDINAWFGPKGTVSPLHHDPKHNLLTQVVGRKRIILYSPEHSSRLYPFGGNLLSNTSEVDPENPDYCKFPDFKNAVAFECHLYPGEMLYIPPKWWHHVRSLDISFSVSFWWI